jgi:peptidase E
MSARLKPIYLLADSRPLFWVDNGTPFLSTVRQQVENELTRAAYIGASNGDKPEFYSIFRAAMEQIRVSDCRMIPSAPTEQDQSFLNSADLVLLSGGDVELGWKVMKDNGLSESLVARFNSGAVLMGVSAGAVQLGLVGWRHSEASNADLFSTLALVPYVVSAHEEDQDWADLKKLVQFMGGTTYGLGIPKGGAAIHYPDGTLQPVRHSVHVFQIKDSRTTSSLLMPADGPGE